MTTSIDGVEVDLDRVQTALDGSRWLWTCDIDDAGQALMLRLDAFGEGVQPLDYIVRWHGALTPQPEPTTAAMYRQVLEAA